MNTTMTDLTMAIELIKENMVLLSDIQLDDLGFLLDSELQDRDPNFNSIEKRFKND